MSKRGRKPEPDSSDDERIGKELELEMTSSSSSEELRKLAKEATKKTAKKPAEEKPKKPRNRIPQGRRMEVIQRAIEGKQDPEYSASKKGTSWVVRRRELPLDQTARLEAPIAPPKKPVEKVEEEPPKKQDELHLSYVNQQASINSKLSKDLEALSEKYDYLAEKYERHKRKKDDVRKYEAELKQLMTDEAKKEELRQEIRKTYHEPPRGQPEPPPRPQTPSKLPAGKYARAKPLSIFEC
jgi:hypothetical protein